MSKAVNAIYFTGYESNATSGTNRAFYGTYILTKLSNLTYFGNGANDVPQSIAVTSANGYLIIAGQSSGFGFINAISFTAPPPSYD